MTIFSFREDRLKALRLEGEITKTVSPEQRLKTFFEFLEFNEALYEAGKRGIGELEK